MTSTIRRAMLALMLCPAWVTAEDVPRKPAAANSTQTTVQLIDEEARPVVGADIGVFVMVRPNPDQPDGRWTFIQATKSDAQGRASITAESRPFVFARVPELGLVGIAKFADAENGELKVTLRPECRVDLQLKSQGLAERGRLIRSSSVIVSSTDGDHHGFFYGDSEARVRLVLPPGEFKLWMMADNVNGNEHRLEIKSGVRQLQLDPIELAASQLELLEGEAAPEIEDVVAWKNGPPVQLSNLRGKVVLLEFWGWWCGPCVRRSIPDLIKLQNECQGQDLIIIGVHTPGDESDDVDTVGKLDTKLTEVREKFWDGQDVTFPVAITRYHKGRYFPGGPESAASKMSAKYGIESFPTTIIIDRQGKVAGHYSHLEPEVRTRILKMLSEK